MKKLYFIIATTITFPVNAGDVILTGDFGKYDKNSEIAEVNQNAKVVDGKTVLTADKILYYKKDKISEAKGNVYLLDKDGKITTATDIILNHNSKNVIANKAKIVDGKTSINADKITYSQQTEISNALGNVLFIDKNGKLTTADKVKLYHKKDDAIAYFARQNQSNDTYIKAKQIFIYGEKNDIAKSAEFSSCKVDEKNKPQAWLLKVDKIVYKEDQDILEMHDVVMNIADVPVMYIPYLQRAAPNVDRLDGWLFPYIGTNNNLGTFVVSSYYKGLKGQQDIILKPIVTSKKTVSVASSYRQKLDNSYTTIDTSYALKEQSQQQKGHLFIDNTYISKSNWKYTSKIEILNDKYYLKDHIYLNHTDKDFLKNSVKIEKNKQSSHFKVELANFRDIRKADNPNIIVTPSVAYETQVKKSKWNINSFTNAKSINKIDEHSSQNISSTVGISQKMITENGIEVTPSIAIRSDLVKYNYAEPKEIEGRNYKDDKKALVTPYASVLMSYPLNFYDEENSFILEPIGGVFISPKQNQLNMVPNNDINDKDYFELDEHSLFSINRYSGTDRIDSGNRASYGLKLKKWKNQNYTHAFIGQSINIYANKSYSNFIGNINLKQNNYKLYAQFELDNETYKIRKLETNGSATFNKTELELTYTQLSPPEDSKSKKTRQLSSKIIYNLNKQWSYGAEGTFDFENAEKRLIRNSIIGIYSNDCGCMTTTLKYTEDYSDIDKPETTLFMQINFKGLTEIKTSDVLKRFR